MAHFIFSMSALFHWIFFLFPHIANFLATPIEFIIQVFWDQIVEFYTKYDVCVIQHFMLLQVIVFGALYMNKFVNIVMPTYFPFIQMLIIDATIKC